MDSELDTVKKYTEIMLIRRGYKIDQYIDTDENNVPGKKPRIIVTKQDNLKAIVFFIKKNQKTDKVNINIIKSVISIAKEITHIIIIHDTVLTSDAKQTITTNYHNQLQVLYYFEVFQFCEFLYDLLDVSIYAHDIKILTEKPYHSHKYPVIFSSDPLARYLRICPGDIVQGRFGDEEITIRKCC